MAILRVISGPDSGSIVEVGDLQITIGRGDSCALKLSDTSVSLMHAIVEPCERGYRIRDLESTAGVLVNGKEAYEQVLFVGDVITLGSTSILFGTGGQKVGSESVGSAETPF